MPPTAAAPTEPSKLRPREPASYQRLDYIDGLRGLAMLMVLVYHCWVHTIQAPLYVPLGRWHVDVTGPLHYGYLGVHLFLVLSGFCLTYPLARDRASGMRLDLRRFAWRRARRILPPYYVALAIFSLLPSIELAVRSAVGRTDAGVSPVTVGQVVSHLFMVHNFSLAWMGAINASFWTLALECQLYLTFPLLVWGFRRWGPARTLAAVLVMTLAYRTWVYLTQDTSRLEVGYIYAYALPGRLFEFALGMMAAVEVAGARGESSQLPARRFLIGALGIGFVGFGVAHGWSPFSPVTDIIWGLAFFCLVLYAGGRSASGGSWLNRRPLVALGVISYSVYLVHEPLIRRGYALVRNLDLSPVTVLLLFELIGGPLLIGVGWLFFRAVEARVLTGRVERSQQKQGPYPTTDQ